MVITNLASDAQVLTELGRRLGESRIDVPLTQAELAQRAGVSLRTVVNLESGKDVRTSSLLRVLRALGLLAGIEALVPEVSARPSEIARLQHRRKRAPSPAKRQEADRTWKWGDEK